MEKVKECLIGNMKLSLESSDDIANFYGGQELLKRELKSAGRKSERNQKSDRKTNPRFSQKNFSKQKTQSGVDRAVQRQK